MDRGRKRAPGRPPDQLNLFLDPKRLAEPRVTHLAGREVEYTLQRSSKRQRVVLTVDDRGLIVHVPWLASDGVVHDALQGASRWVLRKLEDRERQQPQTRRWQSGEWVDFLGGQLRLQLYVRGRGALARLSDPDALEVALPLPHTAERVRAVVVQWYRRCALPHFAERAEHFRALLGVASPRILLSSARSRWGSCSNAGEVRLSWRLMQATRTVIDYVIAHEVAHLKYMSHGPRFWGTVQRMLPDYASARAQLNASAHHYMTL